MAETLINKTQAGDGIWTQDNLIAGTNISITQVEKPVIDEHTMVLCHFDDNIVDSISNQTMEKYSSKQFLYSEGKFGKSCVFNGDYGIGYIYNTWTRTYRTHSTATLTIDTWMAPVNSSKESIFFAMYSNNMAQRITFYNPTVSNRIEIAREIIGTGSSVTVEYPTEIEWGPDTPFHFALVLDAASAMSYVFVNGKLAYSGAQNSRSFSFNVNIYGNVDRKQDEYRISDVARWTSNFTPYSAPYAAAGGPAQYQINNTQDISSKQDALTTATGYDDTKTQVLKNVNGTLTWVDEA